MSRSRGRPAVPSTSRLASRSRTGASSSGLPIAPSWTWRRSIGLDDGPTAHTSWVSASTAAAVSSDGRTAGPGWSGDREVRPREVDDHRRSRDVGDTERHVQRRGRRSVQPIDRHVVAEGVAGEGARNVRAEQRREIGDRIALATRRRIAGDRRDLHRGTAVPQAPTRREVELLGPGRGDAVLVVPVLVGVAHDQPAADGGVDAGRYGVATVGGDHGVDPHLTAVDDDRDEPLDPTLERHGARHASPAARRVAERRHEAAEPVDEQDDPWQRVVTLVVRGEVFGVGIGEQAAATVQLVEEDREVAGDRFEVVAGGHVDHLGQRRRAHPGHARRSRDRAAPPGPLPRPRRPTRRSCAAPSSCRHRRRRTRASPPSPPGRRGPGTGPGVRGHRSSRRRSPDPGSGGPARNAGRPGRRRW